MNILMQLIELSRLTVAFMTELNVLVYSPSNVVASVVVPIIVVTTLAVVTSDVVAAVVVPADMVVSAV